MNSSSTLLDESEYEIRERPATDADNLADRVIAWLRTCDVVEGPFAGQPLDIKPFQEDFIEGFINSPLAALSIPRGNGKTTLLGGIAACSMAGPLAIPDTEIPIVASTKEQGFKTLKHASFFLRPEFRAEPKRYKISLNQNNYSILDKQQNILLKVTSSHPNTNHGEAPPLMIADEPAQWTRTGGEKVYNAMLGGRGKQESSRVAIIGTMPDSEQHWYSQLLKIGLDPANWHHAYAQVWQAKPDAEFDDEEQLARANPMWHDFRHFREIIRSEIDLIKAGGAKAWFLAYRMNLGTPETFEDEFVLGIHGVNLWMACELAPDLLPPREGPCFVGFDIGQHSSLTVAVAYWPVTGRLEAKGALPSSPPLPERSQNDGVPGLYESLVQRGEIWMLPGEITPVAEFVNRFVAHLGPDVVPERIILDSVRKAEARQALAANPGGWLNRVEWRRVGRGLHGLTDITAFQMEVVAGKVKSGESLLMRSALRDAKITRDSNQNPALDKRRARGRIDCLQAAILAIGAGRQWREPGEGRYFRPVNDAAAYVVRRDPPASAGGGGASAKSGAEPPASKPA